MLLLLRVAAFGALRAALQAGCLRLTSLCSVYLRYAPIRSGCGGPTPLRSGPNFPWTVSSHAVRREPPGGKSGPRVDARVEPSGKDESPLKSQGAIEKWPRL
jgi:hypothetical protein